MKQIDFTLSTDRAPKEGEDQDKVSGLHFITYCLRQITLEPGETKSVKLFDLGTGFYTGWTDDDIIAYYDERYTSYGLTTTVSGTN